MKASQLITQLQTLIDEYGDLPVKYSNWGTGDSEPKRVNCYDADGWNPYEEDGNNVPWEFMLH